jgi:hypothetical protein
MFALIAAGASLASYSWFELAGSWSLVSRGFRQVLMVTGAAAIYFAAGVILAYLKSHARRRQFALGCAFALASVLQAVVLSIQWGVGGPFLVFIALAVGVLIAWSLAGAVYLFIGAEDGLVPFVWAGAFNASLLLFGRIVGATLDHSVGTGLLSAIVVAMFVAPAAGIGALMASDLPTDSLEAQR